MQDMTHAVFWHAYCLSYLSYLQSGVCQYEIVDFCHFILRGSRFRGSWLIKNRRRPSWNSLNQFLTVAIEGEESPDTASKHYLISLRDFPSKNKNRITDRYCSSPFFEKSADTSDSTRSQN